MPTDYAKLREENIRRYGSETAHLAILSELYSERTHFIFELLQNSEDAKAGQLQFHLRRNSLEMRHDGRAFNSDDVLAVCSVCQSTNQGDPERIGRFGIGFKSVYAYTPTPEIHSGDEHFAIRHYVRPEAISARTAGNGLTTLIVLPFRESQNQSQMALSEIARAFCRLDPTSLLFLRHIQRVELLVEDADSIVLHRRLMAQPAPWVRVVALASTKAATTEERWLLFERPSNFVTPAGREVAIRVEVAFALTPNSSDKNLTIANRERATLAVFFPTDKLTATGFILQGPYRTTPARDNILADDPVNGRLAHESGELVVAALHWLREKGCLTADVLNTLPLRRAEFPEGSLLRPVFDRVLAAIKNELVLPAHASTPDAPSFIAGNQAKAASSAELRDLLSTEHLRQLVGDDVAWCWLADGLSVRGDSDLACYLRKEVGVREVTASDFVSWLESKDAVWWKHLDETWLIRTYRYLRGQVAEHKRLRKLPIVRLESGEHASPEAKAVFFPADNIKEKKELAPFLQKLPIIRQRLLDDDEDKAVENFLRQMGVTRLEATEFIRRVLIPRYSNPTGLTAEENRIHVRFVFQAFQRMTGVEKQELITTLRDLNWLLCRKTAKANTLFWTQPSKAHLPQTYTGKDSLEVFFSATPETCFVDSNYPREGEKWIDFLESMGCSRLPKFSDDKHEIDGVSNALTRLPTLGAGEAISLSKAILDIVSALVPDDSWERREFGHVWQRRYGPRGGDLGSTHIEALFYKRLKRVPWMPDSSGKLHCPDALFEDIELNRRLLGDGVAYLHKDIALNSESRQWLATDLGVCRWATRDAVLARLKDIKAQDTSLPQVVPLYEFLAQISAGVAKEFEEGKLIYCPEAKPPWLAPSQIFWEDESRVFGVTHGYLEKLYPKLHDFFAKSGVLQSAGPVDYVKALLVVANAGTTDDPTRKRIHRIYKRLVPRLEEGGGWQNDATWQTCWSQLRTGRNWLGRKGEFFGFFGRNELVRVDNEHIAELFHHNLPLWPFADLNGFAGEQLEIAPVSSAQRHFAVEGEQDVVSRFTDDLKESWSLIAAFLYSEKWKNDVQEGAMESFSKPPNVRLAQRIAVTYELNGATAEEKGGKDGFIDVEKGVIWLTTKPDNDDLIEAMGDALQEFFGPEVLREFVCDLFRKGQKKAIEKWRKKGLILSQAPPVEDSEIMAGDSADGPTSPQSENVEESDPASTARNPASGPTESPEAKNIPETPATESAEKNTEIVNFPAHGGSSPESGGQRGVINVQQPEQATVGAVATPATREQSGDDHFEQTSPTGPAKDTKQALHDAFNKEGKISIIDEPPESGLVRNLSEYRKRTRDNYLDRKNREPAAAQRVSCRTVDLWDPKNKAVRDFLYEEYAGRCQICGDTNRFPRRDGKAYFEAVYLIPHSQAAWTDEPGSVICLCAVCSAKFQHGAVECSDIEAQIRAQKASVEGGNGKPSVSLKLVGRLVSITFTERHLIEVQELMGIEDLASDD